MLFLKKLWLCVGYGVSLAYQPTNCGPRLAILLIRDFQSRAHQSQLRIRTRAFEVLPIVDYSLADRITDSLDSKSAKSDCSQLTVCPARPFGFGILNGHPRRTDQHVMCGEGALLSYADFVTHLEYSVWFPPAGRRWWIP